MPSRSFALTLLSLFTSRQRAAEIEGDLIEESEYRGRSWFMIHVIGTTLALFSESLKQAPFRITALVIATAAVSVVACGLLDRVFFAPSAVVPAPFLGVFAVPASAFLTGLGLGYVAPSLGVRAAALTSVLLTLLFLVTQTLSRSGQFVEDLEVGIGVAVLNVLLAFLLTLGGFVFSIVIFLAPLMTGSIYGNSRSASEC